MAKIQNTDHPKYQQRCEAIKNFHSLLVGMQNGIAALEDSWAIPYKPKHTLTI